MASKIEKIERVEWSDRQILAVSSFCAPVAELPVIVLVLKFRASFLSKKEFSFRGVPVKILEKRHRFTNVRNGRN